MINVINVFNQDFYNIHTLKSNKSSDKSLIHSHFYQFIDYRIRFNPIGTTIDLIHLIIELLSNQIIHTGFINFIKWDKTDQILDPNRIKIRPFTGLEPSIIYQNIQLCSYHEALYHYQQSPSQLTRMAARSDYYLQRTPGNCDITQL